jgi:8-oxo-dGTP pyrophosphatase MutT (NUDIX family)
MEQHLVTKVAQYALIIKNKKMLILWPSDKTPLWVLPGGRVNNDDKDIYSALNREAKEEIELEVEIIKPFYTTMYHVPEKGLRYVTFFLCKLIGNEKNIKLSQEHEKYEWLTYDELMEKLMRDAERGKPGIELINKLKEEKFL